ncbi:tRNA lysidine(34) synthetase TilS [Limnoglobus roseus]|uniref:tRNA(Ile)-lysidine synthase n=1 Tax=Limnoglobus roseus TaxID=2598579 RepID=A0A5C1AS52_9BACT|nr:tRNA lysidine(34) synthetase TilS [Limnoglobus roseus]QEL20054.1 tRNA lysidine(34) synthetase TilS [Limnoglobus roseus]
MVTIPDAIRAFFAVHAIPPGGVAAVSGGPDSVALLRGLVAAGCGPITVAHVNHQLRGTESDADEGFVRELATSLSVNVRSARLPVPPRENLESAARRLRYEFLQSVAADVSANWIATGHTANDQAETVLHRLIRGTGVQGLRGVAPKRGNIIRPLLHVSRADVLAYLAATGQLTRTDSTNADRRFTRNRIRHDLLPQLKDFNPEIVPILGRLAEQCDDVFAYLEREAEELLRRVERPRAGSLLILDATALEPSPAVLVREMFRLLWRREGWPMDGMTYAHWQRVGSLQPADYPGGVQLRRIGRVVQLSRRS